MRHAIALCCLALLLAGAASAEFQTATFTATPGVTIPDASDPIISTMTVDLDHYISAVRVYIDVSIEDWSSDLRIWVVSAWDTQVELFHIGEGGEPPTDPVGWYPTDFNPYEDITQWHGEGAGGVWAIICQDLSDGTEGVLNEWRVEIGFEDTVNAEAHTLSGIKALFE